MNHIYKVVWSKVKNCYVVVSEIAHNSGKEHSSRTSHSHRKGSQGGLYALALAVALGLTSPSQADADDPTADAKGVDLGNGGSASYDAKNNLNIGNQVQTEGDKQEGQNNTAIGTNTDTLRNVTEGNKTTNGQPLDTDDHKKLVDSEGQAHDLNDYKSTEAGGSTAVGYNNHNEGDRSTTIGNTAKITNKPVTYYVDADGNKTASQDDAAWYKDSSGNPTKVPQVFRDANGNTTTTEQYIHTTTTTDDSGQTVTKTEITTDKSLADKNSDGTPVYSYQASDNTDHLYTVTLYQASQNSIAAGTEVTANGSNAVAVGYKSTADNSAVAVGDMAQASGDNAIAIGTNSKAADSSGQGSIAIGKGVEANGSSTAVGLNGTEATSGSSAYGNNAVAQNSSAAFGSNIQASSGSYASGIGKTDKPVVATEGSYATGMGGTTATKGSMAVGNNVKAGDQGGGAFAIGMGGTMADNGSMAMGNNVSAGKNGGGAFAVGMGGTTANSGSMAVGNNVKAGENGGGAFAVGMGGTSADGSSMAVGDNVHATGSAFASGRNGTSAQSGGIAYGDNVSAQYGGFAAGTNSTSANSGVAVGSNVHAYDGSSYAGGMNNTTAGNGSIAFGDNVHAGSSSGGAFAAGMNGTTADGSSVAVGNNVHASNGSYAAGMGGTSASGSAAAIGNNAYANGNSYAFGSSAHADSSSAAIGNSSYATNSSLALGNSAGAYVSGGIALGSNSKAYRASGTTGLDPRTGKAYTDTSDKTWNSTYGALSIGNVDSDGTVNGTRQIIGVAAGTNDTDAVNVAQLKAAMNQSGSIHDYSVNSTDTANDTNYSNAGATGKNALAAGVSASATAENAVAIGYGAKADGVGATVIGQYGTATGQYALAFGGSNTDSTGTPVDNTASGSNSVAFGERTAASGNNSTAFGWQTKATEKRATAFGERTTASGANSTAFGQVAVASGQNSTAFGNEAVANNYGSTAFGNRTEALGAYSTAFGNSTVAAGMNTVAFGTDNVAGAVLDDNGAYTNIIYQTNPKNGRVVKDSNGNPIELSREKMDARGNLAYTDSNGSTKSVTYTVSGGETHSYVLLQGEDGNTYIRDYRGNIRSAAIGSDGTVTVGDKPLTNVTLKKATSGANGYNILSNANATVWGENSIASGEASTAFGIGSTASGKNSLAALGGTASAENAAAIGNGAKATLEDSVALGSGSVANRASGAKGYDMLTKSDTTNTSAAWVSNANAIAVGNGSTLTRQITGVAAGSQDTDAVNVAQLKAAGFKVTTQKNGDISSSILNGDTLDFEAKDNAIVSTTKDSKTITVSVSKTPTFDSATFGTTNNEKVTIANGQVSAYNDQQQKRAVVGVDNQGNGTLFLVNDDLSQVHLYTQSSKETGNDGITRMYYTSSTDNGGEVNGIHTIAVLDDGINYAGDNVKPNTSEKVVVKHKLNSTMDITGGADTSNLSDNNIGVVATPAVEDEQGNITQKGKLEIKLNKDLQDLNSVTAGNVRIGNNPANTLQLTEKGQVTENTAPAGNYATGLDNKAWDTKNPSYVSGRAATEDQLAKVSGVVDKGLSFTTNTKDAANTTDNYKGYKVVNRQLGDTISIKAGNADPNMKYETKNLTSQIAENGDITISMADKPTFSEVTASSFNLSPKDTTTKDQAGNTASAQLNAHYRDASLNPDKNVTMADGRTGMVRLHYHDGEGTVHDLATMDDGQVYAGDIKEDGTADTTGFGRKMNEKTTINGGVKETNNLTDNNIGVVSNSTDTLTVKLAKRLTNLESVQAGKTTIDDNGLTIKKSDDDSSKNVVVLGDKVAFGDNQVNNMGSGSDGTADGKPTYNTDTNGANIGDVKNIASSTIQPVIDTVNKGWELDVNGTMQKAVTPTSPKVNLIQGQNITITGDKNNTDNVTIATADDVRFNTVRVGGVKSGDTYSGGILIGTQSGKNTDGTESANSNDDYYITGLKNTNWDSTKIQHGRAATEDQLQAVATEIKNGTVKGDVYVTGGAVSYKGEGEGADPKDKDGTGSINLTRQNGTDVHIDGLHDYYVTGGTVTNDGKTLELTRNDVDGDGNHQKITVDLGNVLKNDLHLVANPAADSNGKYKVDTTTGTVTLKVQNADGTTSNDITIGGFEGLGQGLKFGANKMAKDGGGNPVTNQLGSTINITGAGTKGLTDYSGKNLLTSVEQNTDGNTIVHVLMDKNISADGVTVGQAGKDGVAGADGEVGKAGTIGINGKNGVKGEDGKQGITTTIIRTEKGQAGKDGEIGQQGAPGVDGKDITRIVYQNDQDKVDGKDGSHTVATLDDGLKFSGDDNTVIQKKLNEQLQFVGGANKLTKNNIGVVEKDGKLWIQLAETPDLGTKGNLKAGDAQIGWFNGDILTKTDGTKEKQGSYATGLDNKDWNISNPSYVSGRAATEDQLAKVSNAINNATTAAGKRTVVTVNDKANPAEATPGDGDYGDYDSTNGNLMIAAKKDTDGVLTYNIKLNDKLTLGKDGKDGTDGQEGTIGLTGKDGLPGADGKQGYSTTIIKTEKGQPGADGKNGKPGVDGTDITRIVYADKDGSNPQTVATLSDGLNFAGDDIAETVSKKLNETLQIRGDGTYDKTTQKTKEDGNIQVSADKDTGTIKVVLNKDINLKQDGSLTVGGDTQDGSTTVQDPIIIKHFDAGKLTITGTDKDGKTPQSVAGDYVTGLDNKDWNVSNPTYVSGRAATEDQLKAISDTIKSNAETAAGQHTEITVNDKKAPTIVTADKVGTTDYGDYVGGNDNLLIAAKKDSKSNKMTYNIKLNDQLAIGKNDTDGQDGKDGKDGKVTVETKGGTTVVIGHNGADGDNGKDGLFVTGKDGKDGKSGVSITGPNGATGADGVDGKVGIAGKDGNDAVSISGKDGIGHIGLTGQKGEDGKDGVFNDLSTILGTATLDPAKNEQSKSNDTVSADDKSSRIQYQTTVTDKDGNTKTVITHEVATMDDGLKFAGDDVNTTVDKKLNDTLQIRGDGTYNAATKKSDGNIQTSVEGGTIKVALNKDINLKQDGSLTIGGDKQDDSTESKDPIVIKHFDGKTLDVITGVDKEGKPIIAKVNKAGDYVTGLDNKNWNVDKPEYVSGRAATEDQLKTISDAVKEAATTAGKHTVVTVENGKAAGTTDYNGENLKLKVTEKDGQKTYDLKLNDKVTLGKDGVDGSIGLKGADGKSSIGLNGKDGISVIGKDGQNGVSITGSNGLNGENGIDGKIAIGTPGKDGQPGKDAVSISGQKGEGHIGLTGPAGKDGKDASADIHVKNGQVGVDGTDGHGGKDGMDRVVYEDHNHVTHEVATMDDGMKYAGDFGKGVSVKLNKTVNVKGNAKKEADLTDGNIGVVSSQSGDNGQLLIKLNKDLNLGNNGSVKMGNTTINNDGMTISKTESGKTTTVTLTDKGLNNGGNKITNVAAGTDGTDAVNVSQLNDVKHLAEQHTTVEAGPSGNVKVTSGTNADGSKKYTVDLAKDVTFGNAGNGDKTVAISGTDGTVTAGTGDNKVTVDGSKGQIVAGGDNGVKVGNIADGDSSLTIYDKDGKATGKTDKAGKYVTNLDNKTWNQDGSYVSGRAATEDQLHQVESNVNTKIDNVDKHHTEVTVNGGTAAKADGSYTDGNLQLKQTTGKDGQKIYDLKLNDQIKVGQKGEAGKDGENGNVTVETKGGTTVVLGHDGKDGKDGKDGLFVTGKDGKDGKSGISITGPNGVAGRDGVDGKVGIAGKDGRDAVSIAGRDGVGHIGLTGPKGADGKDGQNASADIHVKNGQVGVDGTDGHGGKDGMDRVVYEDHNGTSHEVATMDDGMKYSGDSGNAAVKLNNNVQLYGGAKEYAAGDNIGVVVSQDGDNAKMQVKLAKDLKGIDSIDAKTVTTGNTTINNSGLTVKGDDKHKDITVQQGTVNMGGNKIEGVAPGKVAPDSTEAINGSQLAQRDQAIGKLGGEVSSLDRRVDRVGAGAAALAALHPQDFDPDDKWDFAVGYGNYRGANAAAVGAFYRPNEDTTLSVGGTVGGGENMVNAGISFKFGQGNHVTNSRVAMAKEILALKDYVQKQDEKIEKLEALVGKQGSAAAPKRRSILFPDVPENHWAYAYVKKLADRGLLEGYPDGEFKGDRTITRYEFAAIFSRALENGASVDGDMERMSEEFEPEIRELSLNRFRVDRVEGKDNDRHKIERVRVNDRDELVKQKNGEQKKRYRDLYGSVIEKDTPADAAK
ncbi:ESPR-type extended signal peptide-containing protein [Mitsuokella multacida]|uniref:ESPR-type extended signal peptide-containing protein n=1 Tax=Mitsuokella multacida TaxID=52226 RepID=UPI00242021F9|nr:ESPR-type extended signal peptide-containing protein [Mitsuokella multacida]